MTQYLFLRILDLEQADGNYRVEWLLADSQGRNINASANAVCLSQVAGAIAPTDEDRKTIVLLPGHSVSVSTVRIRAQHLKHLESAIADAVEEQLAAPMEEVHITYRKVISGAMEMEGLQSYHVAIIDDTLMRRIVTSLQAALLEANFVLSEAMLLPDSEGAAIMIHDSGRYLFRLSSGMVSSLEKDAFLLFFEKYLTQNRPLPKTLQVFLPQDAKVPEKAFVDELRAPCSRNGIRFEVASFGGTVNNWLCGQWFSHSDENKHVNLLQGVYNKKNRTYSFTGVPWKRMAFFVLAWVIVQSSFDIATATYLNYKASRLETQTVELYQQFFPQDHKIVDIRAQTEQHLRAVFAAGTDEFVVLAGMLAKGAQLAQRLEIRSLSYDAKRAELTADVASGDFAVLEQYKQLATKEGFTLELDAVVREQNEVHCQMKIRGR